MRPGYYWFVGDRVQRYGPTRYSQGWESRTPVDEPIQVFDDTQNSLKGMKVLDFVGGMEHITPLSDYEGIFISIERPDEKIFEAEYGRLP